MQRPLHVTRAFLQGVRGASQVSLVRERWVRVAKKSGTPRVRGSALASEGDRKVAPFLELWRSSRFRQNFRKRHRGVIFPRPAQSPHVTLE
jgi:hypothetical protein